MDRVPLPFERGGTYYDGVAAAVDLTDTSLEGQIFTDFDPTTGCEQRLMVVRATGALTAPGGRAMKSDTGYQFKRTAGFVDAAGMSALFCDPAQTSDVISGDLFYCAWDGEWSGLKVDTTNLTLGGLLQLASNGYLEPLTTSDAVCIGVANAAVTAGVAGAVTATVTLNAPLVGQNAA